MADQITLPLADAQMLLSWMADTFDTDDGTDWQDEDAAAVADALHKAVQSFKAMRAACGVQGIGSKTPAPTPAAVAQPEKKHG
jgi:hypothetical protein